ncbi:M48 family metalloprotease [Paucibacter sp. APW11]|uniref:M48 family metalloprotease n=1 Tax=Roseateles aquae TaxID=3077235 RepID=A0ABU3PEK1_9BURK|nr:M48 family metalloprotease [Paucibacter sp. APW11]MDT9000999.1 M48 family metalloprotease [Paucibacter sp. APW11]
MSALRLPRRPLISVLAASLLWSGAAPAQVNLPALGDSVSGEFDVSTEKRLGDQIMRQIRLDPDYLEDPLLLEYVQQTWLPLVAASKRQGNIADDTSERFAWETFLIRDKSVNAFALPGGFVGVHLGLIAMTVSRDELASVLAHELSHITQRHVARRIVGDSRNSLLATAGMVLGLIAASKAGSIDLANAAIVGSQAAAAQASLNFSRDMEREADRVGFNVLVEAGFKGAGMASMFERMEQAYHLMDNGSYPYLRSHPLTTERIGDARARLGAGAPEWPQSVAEHVLMAARARVLMDPRAEFWAQLQNMDAGVRQNDVMAQLGARYASALASIKMRDWARAESAMQTAQSLLATLKPDARAQRAMVFLRAELAQAQEKTESGFSALASLSGDKSRAMMVQRAELAVVDGRAERLRESAETLQTHVSLQPQDAQAWGLLAKLWTKLDQPLRAVRALGETRAAVGDLNGAIDRLRSGLRQSRGRDVDQIEAAVIDARLRSLLYERRQLLEELYRRGVPPGTELPNLR